MDKIFNKPFAVNGARVAIPENGTENERVSFDKGFTQPYEIEAPSVDNPSGQGFNILRPEMNEALYQLSSACNILAENIDNWIALTNENLNDITQAGRYNQKLSNNATLSRNYPTQFAGFLLVFLTGATALTQIYKPFNSDAFFIRRDNIGNGANWSSWDRLILKSESYTKTQIDNRTPSLVLSKIGFGYNNIRNASFTIPNNSFLKTCNIQIMFSIRQQKDNAITFNFKNGNSIVATRKFIRSSTSGQDYDVNDYISGLASFNITSALLGKTITPEIVVTNAGASFLLNQVDLLITYGS